MGEELGPWGLHFTADRVYWEAVPEGSTRSQSLSRTASSLILGQIFTFVGIRDGLATRAASRLYCPVQLHRNEYSSEVRMPLAEQKSRRVTLPRGIYSCLGGPTTLNSIPQPAFRHD